MKKNVYSLGGGLRRQMPGATMTIFGLALLAGFFTLTPAAPHTQAAPFACGEQASLFQYPGDPTQQTTDVKNVDLATGSTDTAFTISGRRINAVGYNVLDNFMYGFDEHEQAVVRIETNGLVTELPDPADLPLFTPGVASYRLGDIDDGGSFWIARDQDELWYEIDLAPGSPDYGEVVSEGSLRDPDSLNLGGGADWAFVPGHPGLYRLMRDGTSSTWLVRFDPDTGTQTALGNLGDLGDPSLPSGQRNHFGAVYSDSDGFLYGSENFSGNIYRIDIDEAEATFFSVGPSSVLQDGARCFTDPVSLDFGDAPASYGTLLRHNGPRHTFQSGLSLGTVWDAEPDAHGSGEFDGSGDDSNGDNDEDGLTDAPPLTVESGSYQLEVSLSNSTGQAVTLAGWVDVNGSGTFDQNERALATVQPNDESAVLSWTGISPAAGDSAIRLRLFGATVADPQPSGVAVGGEVEDHPLTITGPSLASTGSNYPLLAGAAIGLLLASGLLVPFIRRRYAVL